ncbi:secretion protein HlyD [Candidatus Koribacter versatilis Ellin345]|uniref:Secretion protein HlyD n=1 Tax=Koribacter versatilis (strain Ellin345) TaxID=204669 RepID=Q1IJ80_KORVE|nr:efflux RND transporter periplasmic adaptor subunit [Candidatus Koribacter versatilis]ABF43070.1 secretion protein HlyD [Candidatus Koribacter versatilis Ellin345]
MSLEPERSIRLAREIQPFRKAALTRLGFGAAIPTLLLVLTLGCDKKEEAVAPPPPDVQVTGVVQQDVPLYGEWVATLDGFVNAQIAPQVSGYLMKQNYREGSVVKKGDVLFEIDPRPFEAALDQAKGNFAETQAKLGKTELDVKRDTPLAAQSAIPQAQLDNDIQANEAAKAMIVASQAQVQQAELNVGFTKVRSLVDGIAGLAKGQIGDLVGPTTILTTVSQVSPIKAYVSISEQEYLRAAQRISMVSSGQLSLDKMPRNLELILSDGTTYKYKGYFVVADRQVDLKTGTIRLAAAFDNPEGILRPGQFARLRVETRVAKDALLVPQRAVVETQGSYSVVVVGSDSKASIRPVKTGERVGELWIITEGLKPGEQVIVEGMQKAKEGSPVKAVQAQAEPTKAQGD